MPDNGNYLLTNVGFSSDEKPLLLLQDDSTFIRFNPVDKVLTLRFDTHQRYCIGWRDIINSERFTCPNKQTVDAKYEQCNACQKRTGFNPAFYHAASVSPQQEARNQEPHILYLAHFGNGVIKVGISLAKRGNARLLEQGARSAMILEALPSAYAARQYEAQIARLPGFSEAIQQRKKIDLLHKPYDITLAKNELINAKKAITTSTGLTFNDSEFHTFDTVYFPKKVGNVAEAHNLGDQHLISGMCVGQLGALLFCAVDDALLYLPLKKYVGYRMTLSDAITPISTPARQTSLF